MEFGTLIPLFFLQMCCFIVTPIAGFSSLAFIRFSMKDKQLARNILFTVVTVAVLAFLYPMVELIVGLIHISRCCPDTAKALDSEVLYEMISTTFRYALFLIIPSLSAGFILAFSATVPVTLWIRSRKKAALGNNS